MSADHAIGIAGLTDADRFRALVGIGRGLLDEAAIYGLKITLCGGRPTLAGIIPQEAEESLFLNRLRAHRQSVIAALDSLARGWTVQRDGDALRVCGPDGRWPDLKDGSSDLRNEVAA